MEVQQIANKDDPIGVPTFGQVDAKLPVTRMGCRLVYVADDQDASH